MALDISTCSLLLLSALALAASSPDVIIKPVASGAPIGVVFIQGASIDASAYSPLCSTLQHVLGTYNLNAWVGIPSFLEDIAEPAVLAIGIKRVVESLHSSGLPASAPLFVAGHSLGGATIQLYVSQHPAEFKAQILLGAFLLRSSQNGTYATPTMTIGAELDGLTRVTRVAEAYYHQILHPHGYFLRNATLNYPVTLVRGMSHMQFASGTPPPFVKAKDLRPEITEDAAHTIAANDMAAFIAVQYGGAASAAGAAVLSKREADSDTFFEPLIHGFETEASYHLKPPCYDNPPSDACWYGCPWTKIAQVVMGGVQREGLSFNVTDGFHVVSDIHPVHLPHVLHNCTNPSETCTIQMITVSQNMYDAGDITDTAITPVSAYEIRAKLKSRQTVNEAAGIAADFNKTDTPSLCAEINSHAIEWAETQADPASLARYRRIGEPYVLGEDLGPYNAGPLWIGAPVIYKNITNSTTGLPAVEVRSPMMRTPSKYIIEAAAGMHYCKLLSPSRVLEWIYVDSLRLRGGISPRQ